MWVPCLLIQLFLSCPIQTFALPTCSLHLFGLFIDWWEPGVTNGSGEQFDYYLERCAGITIALVQTVSMLCSMYTDNRNKQDGLYNVWEQCFLHCRLVPTRGYQPDYHLCFLVFFPGSGDKWRQYEITYLCERRVRDFMCFLLSSEIGESPCERRVRKSTHYIRTGLDTSWLWGNNSPVGYYFVIRAFLCLSPWFSSLFRLQF